MSTGRTVQVIDPVDDSTFALSGDSDDFSVIGAIERSGGRYEESLLLVADQVTRPGAVCLDIGANIGFFAVYLARHCPGGRVVAFEPGKVNVEHLRRNIELNGLDNVEVEARGVFDTTGTLTLNFTPQNPGGSFISDTAIDAGDLESIEVVTIDTWAEDHNLQRLDIVKIDVEGSELRVIRGADRTLRRFKPALFVECNPVSLRRFQHAEPSDLVAMLRSIYGSVRYLTESGSHFPLRNDRQLDIELARQAVVELACGLERQWPPRWNLALFHRATSTKLGATLMAATGTSDRAPRTFVHDPSLDARFGINHLVAPVGASATIPIRFKNTSRFWWMSEDAHHPVTVGHRWLLPDGTRIDDADGMRALLPRHVGPGQSVTLSIVVRAPSEPGTYGLRATLVQESYLWFDDLRPEMAATLRVDVV